MRPRLVSLLSIALLSCACQASIPLEQEAAPQLPGRVFRVTGYSNARGHPDQLESMGARIIRATDGSSTVAPPTDMPNWPRLSTLVRGRCALRVLNVNDCDIRVGLRDGGSGRDLLIPMGGTQEATLPDGRYSVYVQYGAQPGVLYEGPSLKLGGGETVVEILPPR